jgi:drug/metabolite transporter (DMT)-like permease
MLITRKVFGYGLLTMLPLMLARGVNYDAVVDGGVQVWGNVLFLGCVASMLCFLGWNFCLERLGTVRATNLLYLNPVISITTSAIVLGERVTWIAILGAVLILTGLYCMRRK